jgi:hypothetical protein
MLTVQNLSSKTNVRDGRDLQLLKVGTCILSYFRFYRYFHSSILYLASLPQPTNGVNQKSIEGLTVETYDHQI